MESAKLTIICTLIVSLCLLVLATGGEALVVSNSRMRRNIDPKQLNPDLTKYEDYCPNGYIAYNKFNTTTGTFDCQIKTAEICFALCDTVASSNWDITNPTSIMDPTEQSGWYCRALPGFPTRPCYFKPKRDIERDVHNMLIQNSYGVRV